MAKLIDSEGNVIGDTNETMAKKKAGLMEYQAQIKKMAEEPTGPLGAEAPVKVKKEPPAAKQKIKGGY